MTGRTVELYRYVCGNCGSEYKAPARTNTPARLILRGEGTGEAAAVDGLDDAVFAEVGALVRRLAPAGLSERRYGRTVQQVFSIACDLDATGLPYAIGAPPRCPTCGSSRVEHWQSTDPPEHVPDDLPSVTHREWEALGSEEKERRVAEAINDVLSA